MTSAINTSQPLIHFAHANGFHSDCYVPFLAALRQEARVIRVPMLGHDPRFSIAPNWHGLGEQLAESVRSQSGGEPVIAVGHSLGGMSTLIAANRYPELFRGVILLDPAYINPLAGLGVAVYKRLGRIDEITPAGRSLGRRSHWPNKQAVHDSLRHKGLFKPFTDASFQGYLDHGLVEKEDGVHLRYDPAVEVDIFRHTPSDAWRYRKPLKCPVAVITGETSEFLKRGTMHKLAKSQRVTLQILPGGHMFPFEHPDGTAAAVLSEVRRMVEVSAG